MMSLQHMPVIAAIRSEQELEAALSTGVGLIFDLTPDLLTLARRVRAVHQREKQLFIHLDLATGIGKDKSGIEFSKAAGVDGIISTRSGIIKLAREAGLFTVQRFFVVDSQSVETATEAVKASKPDLIEVMPGIAAKVIRVLKQRVEVPIIAGGLIESADEVKEALSSGAAAVSTGRHMLWEALL